MPPPNFIVFLTDDQGYGDLSCMGATDFRTPHLDRLASQGARFTSWYSNSPVCSPSRASLLTGRYPGNAGVRSILAGRRTTSGLPPKVPTIASVLRERGYATALSGKWHLGLAPGSLPQDHGFTDSFGFLAGCEDYYSHLYYYGGHNPLHDLWENGKEVWRNGEYLTTMFTDRAIQQIRKAARASQPFFLYVAYNAPHYPMHAPPEYLDRFPSLPPDRRIMAAMLSAVDDGVGAVMAELERQGIAENTCSFFQSDNGPSRESRNWLDGNEDHYYGGSAGLLKGHKFSLFEGGIRVPGILTWPARIPASQVIEEPAAAMDIFPTFLKAAGGDPGAWELDGRDILPVAAKGAASPHAELFWEMNRQTAIRRGPWKLVMNGQLEERVPPGDEVHLSNLEDDHSERVNLKDLQPALVTELRAAAEAWRDGIEDRWQQEWLPEAERQGAS